MIKEMHALAERWLQDVFTGKLGEEMFTADFAVWSIHSQQDYPLDYYREANSVIISLFPGGVDYRLKAITAEADRAVVEVEAAGMLKNGVPYHCDYAFILRIREGKIARIEEFFDVKEVEEKIFPLLAA